MKALRAFLVSAFVLTLCSPMAQAATRTVHCVGTPLSQPCDTNHTTIQQAVAASSAGDAVFIAAGTYNETVTVTPSKAGLLIRGENRNTVVLDGLESGNQLTFGLVILANNVEVSNLTTREYSHTGVYWIDVAGYRATHITAYNNGLYGLYAFKSSGPGYFADSYGSGHPDSAFYIGECNPCDAVIERVYATRNGLGYSGTNANGNLIIRDSEWVHNGGGIVPNTLDSEDFPPQCCIIIEDNLVVDQSEDLTIPSTGSTVLAAGIGIGIAGGDQNLVRNNVVLESSRYGIAITPFPEPTPNLYRPKGNRITNNVVAESGLFDLALAGGSDSFNCFSGNTAPSVEGNEPSSDPPMIQTLYPCSQFDSPLRNSPVSGGVSVVELASGLITRSAQPSYLGEPHPGDQPTMSDPNQGL